MSLPEKIWAKPYDTPWDDGGVWEKDTGGGNFIRADLVDELVKALEEARESIHLWADIDSDATQTRHDPSDDLAKIDAALARIKGDGK